MSRVATSTSLEFLLQSKVPVGTNPQYNLFYSIYMAVADASSSSISVSLVITVDYDADMMVPLPKFAS